jgi:hypothetical protein
MLWVDGVDVPLGEIELYVCESVVGLGSADEVACMTPRSTTQMTDVLIYLTAAMNLYGVGPVPAMAGSTRTILRHLRIMLLGCARLCHGWHTI